MWLCRVWIILFLVFFPPLSGAESVKGVASQMQTLLAFLVEEETAMKSAANDTRATNGTAAGTVREVLIDVAIISLRMCVNLLSKELQRLEAGEPSLLVESREELEKLQEAMERIGSGAKPFDSASKAISDALAKFRTA